MLFLYLKKYFALHSNFKKHKKAVHEFHTQLLGSSSYMDSNMENAVRIETIIISEIHARNKQAPMLTISISNPQIIKMKSDIWYFYQIPTLISQK